MSHYEFSTIRSNRKTIAVEISHRGILVRAPRRMSDTEIASFLKEKEAWIERDNVWNRGAIEDGIVLLGDNPEVATDGNIGSTHKPEN